MAPALESILNSKFVDTIIKITVPVLIGVSGYFFSFILDTSSRFAAIESSRFTRADGETLREKMNTHDTQISVLEANQNRVISTLDKSIDNQLAIMQNLAELKAITQRLDKNNP